MKLLPYQRRAIAKVGESIRAGKRRILLVAPTGSGKTVVLSHISSLVHRKAKRGLWLVNRRELVAQTVRTLEAFDVPVGHSGQNLTAPFQVMTYQGALAAGEVPPADWLFPDEAHHLASSGEWMSILKAYPEAGVVGATATPQRGDGKALDFFEHMIVVAQAADLVALWESTGGRMGLVPCEVLGPPRELNGLARTPAKATVMHKLRDHRQIVFAPHVKAAEAYVQQFREIGSDVALVTGATPKEEREAILRGFRAGSPRVLVNCMVLTEGFDDPGIEVVTLARRCQSIGAMIQMVGRGLRPHSWADDDGVVRQKTRCVVLDLFGVCNPSALGHPLMDREFSLEGDGISGPPVERIRLSLCMRCKQSMPDEGDTCLSCGWVRPGLEVPKELGIALERLEFRRAALLKNDEETRSEQLARWTKALGKGALFKYRACYGPHNNAKCKCAACRAEPPASIIRHAAAIVADRTWCPTCQHSIRDGRCRCALTSQRETGT